MENSSNSNCIHNFLFFVKYKHFEFICLLRFDAFMSRLKTFLAFVAVKRRAASGRLVVGDTTAGGVAEDSIVPDVSNDRNAFSFLGSEHSKKNCLIARVLDSECGSH